MTQLLHQIFEPDPVQGAVALLLTFAVYILLGLLPLTGLLYVVYFVLTLPMRRTERVRMFLDWLELGLKSGQSPESALIDAAASRDRSLGVRFQLLAAYLEQGLRLTQALEKVPRLVPPQVRAMLAAGERIGDVGKVLPACGLQIRDSVSQVRGAINYVVLVAFVMTPFTFIIPLILKVKVLPSFRAVFEGMLGDSQLPAFTRLIFAGDSWLMAVQCAIVGVVWFTTLAYLGGPRLRRWVAKMIPGGSTGVDWLILRLPWRRKRLQRDFSAMLAVLLESRVPEPEAVRLAGEATANVIMRRRAEDVVLRLQQGLKLPDAIRAMDDSGELQWRLANALRPSGSFVRALAGWHEALEAKAFQQEQTAAQLATTFLVLLNGLVVACIVIGLFIVLIDLLNHAILW